MFFYPSHQARFASGGRVGFDDPGFGGFVQGLIGRGNYFFGFADFFGGDKFSYLLQRVFIGLFLFEVSCGAPPGLAHSFFC